MCAGRVFHATDALKKKEVVCLVVRAAHAGRISCLGFLWDRGLREKAKTGSQFVSGSCWRFKKRWSRHKLAISRRQRSDGQSRALSNWLLGVCHTHMHTLTRIHITPIAPQTTLSDLVKYFRTTQRWRSRSQNLKWKMVQQTVEKPKIPVEAEVAGMV